MPDDTQDVKAQKLAAARKKLKEYQQRNNNNIEENIGTNTNSSTVSIASNLSERSDCELSSSNGVGSGSGAAQSQQTVEQTMPAMPSAAAYFSKKTMPTIQPETEVQSIWPLNGQQNDTNLQTIQVLIAEKAQLNTELTKSRHLCRERELELEELRTEHGQTMERLDQMQQHCQELQRNAGQQRNQNAELQHKLAVASAQIEDQKAHLSELEAQVQQLKTKQDELQQQHTEKCNELEMAQLRIRQLSDESNVNADNRVETLTQTQYMYEQQIRDLQQMVSQLTQDKEQAAIQYQNYVASLKERNAELTEEAAELKERERQLVEHVSGLERDIQKNLALQAQYKEAAKKEAEPVQPVQTETASSAELAALKEKIEDLEFERHEFLLKIKSQDNQLELKELRLVELEQELARLQTEQPNQLKLLATMESDKVAASRALSQNMDMKQQLDELQQRFVQLTNDKLELVNKLDAEEFANREMRQNYASMEQKLKANEERFKFKDEEMIRLSHENVELQRTQLMLQQQVDRLRHYEAKVYHSNDLSETDTAEGTAEHVNEQDHHEHKHGDDHHHHHEHKHGDDHHHHHHDHHEHQEHSHGDQVSTCKTPLLPTADAVEKLQSRFTTLISKVADLTEEKQSLEHLVLQLQSETETIGEYIALYQTQRRMLKQREYEKAAQMRLLKAEREQLREKIDALNKLVGSLGLAVDLPGETAVVNNQPEQQQQQQSPAGDNAAENENSQQIIHKIQDIITEIKVNTEQAPSTGLAGGQAVDHLNCCLGKFEVV
ncbi:PREDICTED: golgin subfamily A member 2 isoform X2 [Drosophila arizonae]|uniref:Golgin subfamily A member 2 isoform X2 n=1 Tax=Drosophila arizonae TaxID=7263 RepID=A0ABM1PNB9_DROAR|nr:PREDICTED: golgin subfamily A member 2 isoform X2 [Drosophila arizonae]